MNPRISVLVPTRNRRETLAQTLSDLQAQTRDDFEIIVGDDASSDDTAEFLRAFPNPRLRVLRHEENVGIYPNWNSMLREARGEFVAIYHDHDVYRPTILEESAARLEADSGMAMVHTAVIMVDDSLRPLALDVRSLPDSTPGPEFRRLLAEMRPSPVMAATTLVRRSAYEAVGPYDDSVYGLGCDKGMWFRLASVGSIGYVREPQAFIRARTRGEGTGGFRWSATRGSWRMWLDQIAALDDVSDSERARLRAKALAEIATMHDFLMQRSVVIGTEEERQEGEVIAEEFGLGLTSHYRMLRSFPPAQRLARKLLLPRHHRKLELQEGIKRHLAEQFMRSHPQLAQSLVERRPEAAAS